MLSPALQRVYTRAENGSRTVLAASVNMHRTVPSGTVPCGMVPAREQVLERLRTVPNCSAI